MKSRLSSCGLNQTRTRGSMQPPVARAGARAATIRLPYCAIRFAGVAERHAGRVRVAAVGDHLNGLRRTAVHPFAEAARNRERHPGAALRRGSRSISFGLVTTSTIVKVGDASKRAMSSRLAAERSASATTTGTFPDVGRRRVAEQEQLEDRRDDHDATADADPVRARSAPSRSGSGRAASSAPLPAEPDRRQRQHDAPSTPRARPGRARRHRAPTPFSTMPRSAIRK